MTRVTHIVAFAVSTRAWIGIVVAGLVLSIAAVSRAGDESSSRGAIVGRVTDPSGMPIQGVSVGIAEGPSTLTDIGGRFELGGLKQRRRITVDFSKAGYVSTQAVTYLKADDGEEDDQEEEARQKLDRVTLNRTMLPAGATRTLDTSIANTVDEGGSKVAFPAGSLAAAGAVEVSLTPIDVSAGQLLALPGELTGTAEDGSRVLLEALSPVNVSITQNGQPVDLKAGTAATLEFLLPAATSRAGGETVPLYFYSEAEGRWVKEGSGTVSASTSAPGRLSVIGSVSHFTWWSPMGDLRGFQCLAGTVTGANGEPKAGVDVVLASGSGPQWVTYDWTDAEGRYSGAAARDSMATVSAFLQLDGGASYTARASVATTAGGVDCLAVPTLVLPPPSCVRGHVRDASDNAVAGLSLFSSAGSSATTDVDGAFCLGAPGGGEITVHVPGFPSATVTTPSAEGSCAAGGCAEVLITPPTPPPPPPPPPPPACVQGDLRDAFDNPVTGVTVTASSGDSATTGPDGSYCLSAPVDSSVTISASGFPSATVATSAAASCGSGGCALAPLRLPPPDGPTACARVTVAYPDGNPAAGFRLEVWELRDWPDSSRLLGTGVTDENGVGCVSGLSPDLNVSAFAGGVGGWWSGRMPFNTGPAGGSCTSGGCVNVPITVGQPD